MEGLNEIRKQARNRLIVCIAVFAGLELLSILMLVLRRSYSGVLIAVVPFILPPIGVIVTALVVNKPRKQYRAAFKQAFVLRSLESVFTDLVYEPETGISYETIAGTKMMDMGDRFHSEDYVSGRYRDIFFEQSDVHIEEKHESTDSDGHTSTTWVTIFKGRWMIFDFNKEFKANLQIAQNGFPNARRKRFFGKKETLFKKVEMESESFNKNFRVFAQNEHDAFYIITPAFMERLENLAAHNRGKLLFCFVGDRLHIAIHDNQDSFEPGGLFSNLDEERITTRIRGEIEVITQFIDELNLDNNLFKMEE